MLYGKLFTVMGILWIFECIHYLVHGDHTNMECLSAFEFFLRIIGCINLLRGCLIFFILEQHGQGQVQLVCAGDHV